ncbi:MAG: helix-turn-helix domain-containing protein [Pyrinomonadaceae bacterium]
MENLTVTQLTEDDIRAAIRTELENYFAANPLNQTEQADEIGGLDLAERITGYKPSTIYDLVFKRQIPHSKRGKKLIFSRAELTAWLQENRRRTQSELKAEASKIAA